MDAKPKTDPCPMMKARMERFAKRSFDVHGRPNGWLRGGEYIIHRGRHGWMFFWKGHLTESVNENVAITCVLGEIQR